MHEVTGSPWQRPVRRGADRLACLLTALWQEVPEATLPGEVLLERDLRPGRDEVTPYTAFDDGERLHHVVVRGAPPQSLDDVGEIILISGVCLFSAAAAFLVSGDSEPLPVVHARAGRDSRITGLMIDDRLTLQEEESTARLASVSAALAAGVPAHKPVRQVRDVPCAATMLHLLQHAYDGELSARQLGEWCDPWVSERHARVSGLLRERQSQALPAGSRRVHADAAARPQMPTVEDYLHRELRAGRLPAWSRLVELAAGEAPLWRRLIGIARPGSPAELAYLSYAATPLLAAQHHPDAPPPLVIMVDNPVEHQILRYARRYARTLSQAEDPISLGRMVGVYALPRILVADASGQVHHNLYSYDPGRHVLDQDRRRVDLADLAASMYAPTRAA